MSEHPPPRQGRSELVSNQGHGPHRRHRLPVPPPSHRSQGPDTADPPRSATPVVPRPTTGPKTAGLDVGLERPGRASAAIGLLERSTAPLPAGPGAGDPGHTGLPAVAASDPGAGYAMAPADRGPGHEPPSDGGRLATRVARGVLLVGITLATAALTLSLPGQEGPGEAGERASTRVETADGPTASAALLASDGTLDIDGSLADPGDLGPSSTSRGTDPEVRTIVPTSELSTVPGSATDAAASSETTGADPTTTTAWIEPTLPPENEWVDSGNGVMVPDLLLRIRFCESTNDYRAANRSSSARGAYQFLTRSWEWYGHAERTGVDQAHLATPAQQDEAALRTLQSEGTGPWTASRACWSDPDIDPRYAAAAPPTTAAPARTTTTATGSTETTADTTSTTADSSSTASTAPSASSTTTSPSSTAPETSETTGG